MSAPTYEPLTQRLRARQAAARCARQALACDAKARRYPEGSALRADWSALARDYRATAADWRGIVLELTEEPGRCGCGGDHDDADHDTLAALDEDADRAS